ncbi:MAG TPA: hypothetical protein VMT58_06075, partial [Candidatus Binataceae bacterium]|nr:hypothetical protein [Candidatus Binataceae bacterium]
MNGKAKRSSSMLGKISTAVFLFTFAAATLIAGTPTSVGDTVADALLQQPDFTHNEANRVDAKGIYTPAAQSSAGPAVAIDRSTTPNHVYIDDPGNSRVLGWNDAESFDSGDPADLV